MVNSRDRDFAKGKIANPRERPCGKVKFSVGVFWLVRIGDGPTPHP
jgi:hypothetical protein